MARRLIALVLLAACGGAKSTATTSSGPPVTGGPPAEPGSAATPPADDDPRIVQLRQMTELLGKLVAEVERITGAAPPSPARCAELADALTAWGEAHYPAYETADGEGVYLGIRAEDDDDPVLRDLARTLARSSALLVDLVDQDCLYGSGAYGELLYEYLVAYQGLAHWVQAGDPSRWDYEALIDEP